MGLYLRPDPYLTRPASGGGSANGTSADKFSVAGTGFRWSTLRRATHATNSYFVGKSFFGTPDYDTTTRRFLFACFATGTNNVEDLAALAITILSMSFKDPDTGTWTKFVFNGGAGIVADPAGALKGVWTPDIEWPVAANKMVEYRVNYSVAAGAVANGIAVAIKNTSHPTLIDGTAGATSNTTMDALMTNNGTVNGGGHTDVYLPVAMVCKGGDGRPAIWCVGDSIGMGTSMTAATSLWTDRRTFGGLEMGLDDNVGAKRLAYHNTCIAGNSPSEWRTRSWWQYKLDLFKDLHDALGYISFHRVFMAHGHNAGGPNSLGLVLDNKGVCDLIHSEVGSDMPITAVEVIPSPLSTNGYQSAGAQSPSPVFDYPTGAAWQWSAAVEPGGTYRLDGTVDDNLPWWEGLCFDTGSQRDLFPVLTGATTLTVALSPGALSSAQVADTTAFAVGDGVIISTTGSNVTAGTFSAGTITAITPGVAPAGTLTLAQTANVPAGGWSIGTGVFRAVSGDGTHPFTVGHHMLKAPIAAWKVARGLA